MKKEDIISTEWYSIPQVAEMLGYKTPEGVRYLVSKGYFKNVRTVAGTPMRKKKEILGKDLIQFKKELQKGFNQ